MLPFASNGDSALSYLADGIPEEIRTVLSTIPGMRRELASQSLQHALSLKPDSPLVLAKASEAQRLDDYEGALALAERALRIDPNNIEALWARYRVQEKKKDFPAALKTAERLMRLEPMSVSAMTSYFSELHNADRHQQGLEVANRALALYPATEVPYAHAWAADSKRKLGDRLGAIDSSRKGMPYGIPTDLWTGLAYDWEFFDNLDPLRRAVELVYVEEYDQIRQILIDTYDAVELDSTGADAHGYYRFLDYLLSRGTLEALAVLFAYRKSGRHEQADIFAAQFEHLLAEDIDLIATVSDLADYRYLYRQAQYYAIEGRTTEALGKLRTWVDYEVDLFTYIKWDPFLENLRGDPEFEAVVAEVEAELAEIRMQYLGVVRNGQWTLKI